MDLYQAGTYLEYGLTTIGHNWDDLVQKNHGINSVKFALYNMSKFRSLIDRINVGTLT